MEAKIYNKGKLVDYQSLKMEVWGFIDSFRGKEFSKGDMRAYISLLTDLNIANGVNDYAEALYMAFEDAKEIYKSGGVKGVKEDYWEKVRKWLTIDRTSLHAIPPKGTQIQLTPLVRGANVVSLFTGAYGLDLGFELAGYNVLLGLDMSEPSYKNFKANRPKIPFIHDDISSYTTDDILKEAGIKRGELDMVTGGPPCQPFSTAGKREGLQDYRSKALVEYIRFIKEAQPKAFVMEEVTGILNSRLVHVSIKERGKRPLKQEEQAGSLWKVVLSSLQETGYKITWGVLNAADFGTPQERERVIVVGFRSDIKASPSLPSQQYSRRGGSLLVPNRPWISTAEVIMGISEDIGYMTLPPKYTKYMIYVPGGGNWRQIPSGLRLEAMNNAYTGEGGKMGFYRRLSWFDPSPTLVTSPIMKATMLIHPWYDRPIGVREYLKIQGFPDYWKVVIGVQEAYKLFGEAVPVPLAYAIATHIGVRLNNFLS
jgi:DNA (cytosine-5)-methyltransferase 1